MHTSLCILKTFISFAYEASPIEDLSMAALDELDKCKEECIPLAAYIKATEIRSKFQRIMQIYGKVHSGVNRGDNLYDGELENISVETRPGAEKSDSFLER